MEQVKWYRLFNRQDFIDTGLVSYKTSVVFENEGEKEILITRGFDVGITFEDTFLPVSLNEKNPFRIGEKAIFIDLSGDVWLGVYSAS